MSDGELDERGIFGAIKGFFGGGKKPSPKKKAPKKPSAGFNKFKYAPGEGCGTGAGGFKAGNNCSQGAGFNTPQAPKAFAGKGQVAASLPVKAKEVEAYAKHLKQKVVQETQVAQSKAAEKAAMKAIYAKIKAKAQKKKLEKAIKEAEKLEEAKRAAEKAAKAAKEADRAKTKAAEEAAAKAKADLEAKRKAEKDAARAAKKAEEDAKKAAEEAAAKVKQAEEEAAAAKAKAEEEKKAALADKKRSITFTPGDTSFDGVELNGVKLAPPSDPEFWKTAGDSGRFKEPPFAAEHSSPGFDTVKKSFGCIVVEPDGRVWLIEPKGHFGGYEHTFPKGGKKSSESNQQAAMREVFEESGLQVKIQGHLGDYEKTSGVTRYYIAKRVGGSPSLMGHESGSVKLVPFDKAKSLLNKDIDKKILDDAQAKLKPPGGKKPPKDAAEIPAPPPPPKPAIPQPTELKFSKNLGGSTGAKLMIGPDGKKYVAKQGNSSEHLKSEALADDLYDAAGVKVANKIVGKDADGIDTKVAEFVGGKTLGDLKVSSPKQYEAAVKKLKKDFVADALLGNWDVVGMNMDNVIVSSGNVYRIDNGGSLLYRAQGALKGPGQFGSDVSELSSMRDASKNASAAAVYGSLTDKEISAQITKVLKKKEAMLAAAASNPTVASILEKRFDSLAKWQQDYKKGLKSASKAKTKAAKVAAPAKNEAEAIGAPGAPKQGFSPAKEKASHELPKMQSSIEGTIASAYGHGESDKSKGWLSAFKSMVTDRALSWADRKNIGSEIWKKLSSASRNAFSSWSSSADHIRGIDVKVSQGGKPDALWKHWVAGLDSMPTFVGGPLFRGMRNIGPGNARRWIESGEWTSAPYSGGKDGTGNAQYSHQSFDTRTSVASSFAGGGDAKTGVLVVLKNSKTAKDGCGKIGLGQEHEVIVRPTAKHSVDSYYWLYQGPSNEYIKKGTPVTSSQYSDIMKKQGVPPHKDFEKFHSDPKLLLVLEVSEL